MLLLQAEDFYGRNDEVAAEQDANSGGSGNGLGTEYGAEWVENVNQVDDALHNLADEAHKTKSP